MLQNTCGQLRQKLESIKNLKKNFDDSLRRAGKLGELEGLNDQKKFLEDKINEVEEILAIHLFPKFKKEYQAQENPLRWGEFNFGDNNKNRVEEIKKLKTYLNTKTLEKKVLFQIILGVVQARFEAHIDRHPKIIWENVEKKFKANPGKMLSLCLMELTGGEPNIVDYDEETDEYIFYDLSAETPKGRRNLVYDQLGEELFKTEFPKDKCNENAVDMGTEIGIEILDESRYRYLAKFHKFDVVTWSWIKTPYNRRKTGVALYGSRDGLDVFVLEAYPSSHNVVRGFRGSLMV